MDTEKRAPKKLLRHPTDRVVSGVCGGIADFTGIALRRVRIAAFLLIVLPTGGIGLVLYIMLWLMLPVGTQAEGPVGPPVVRSRARRERDGEHAEH